RVDLDDAVPGDRTQAFSGNAQAKTHGTDSFELDCSRVGAEARILAVEILAGVRAGPEQRASAGRENLRLQGLIEDQVADTKRKPDLRRVGGVREQQQDSTND